MNILALDTSSKAASCAVLSGGELLGEFFGNAGLTHSQTILPMVKAMLDSLRMDILQIDRFAVCVGPGSFTGLRIGIAAVKGMAMASQKLCAGVSTLETLALNLQGAEGIIAPVMDARRAQVYAALFCGESGEVRRLTPDEAVPIEEWGARLASLQARSVTLVGDGARLCFEKLQNTVPGLRIAPAHLLHQRASSVALAAAELEPTGWKPAEEVAPIYLRLPQAERELREKQQGL